jgi:hypothetical protein
MKIQRREFITLLGGVAAAWPLAARAQQPGMPVVGYLYGGVPEAGVNHTAAFRRGLTEAGYVEGRNVTIAYRWGHNNSDRFAELAADLVRRKVSVIVTAGSSPASLAAKAATATIRSCSKSAPTRLKLGWWPVSTGREAMSPASLMNRTGAPKTWHRARTDTGPAPLGRSSIRLPTRQ